MSENQKVNRPKKDFDYMFKVVLIGAARVGKSNILLRSTRNQFRQSYLMTVGVEFASKDMEINNKAIKLQIWDTLGQQQYKAIMRSFYKGASAVILVYDITQEQTYHDLDFWYGQVQMYCKSGVVLMLVGNKSDLEEQRSISKQKGLEFAEKHKIAFYQVSAKDGTNIELIFTKVAEELLKIMQEAEKLKKQSVIEDVKIENMKGSKIVQKGGSVISLKKQGGMKKKGKCCKN